MVSNTTSDVSLPGADWRDRVALWGFGLLWVLPFIQPLHDRPMLHFHSEWLAVAVAVAGCALLLVRGGAAIAAPRAALWLLALLAWIGLQLIWVRPVFPQSAHGYMIYLGWAGLVMLAAGSLRERLGLPVVAEVVAWCALAGGVLDAAAGLMQIYGAPDWLAPYVLPGGEVTSIIGNARQQNHLGDHVMMGLAGVVYLHGAGRLPRTVMAVGAAVMLPALALCASRSVLAYFLWLLILTGAAWGCAMRGGLSATFARRGLSVLALLLATFLLLQALLPWLSGTFGIETVTTFEKMAVSSEDVAGMGVRLQLWEGAWRIFLESPWLGWGADSFAWHYFRVTEQAGLLGYTMHSHNLLLEVLVCFGVIGGILLAGIFLPWLAAQRRHLAEPATWLLLALLGVMGIHAMLELPFWYAHFLGLAAFLVGAGDVHRRLLPAASRIVIAIVVLVAAWGALSTARGFRDIASLWVEKQSITQLNMRYRRAAENPLLRTTAQSVIADANALDRQQIRAKLALNTRIMHWRPYPRVVYRQVALMTLAGETAASERLLERALRIYPQHHRFMVCTVLRGMEYGEARHALEETVPLFLAGSGLAMPECRF